MPSLDDILAKTMMFTAAAGAGATPEEITVADFFQSPEPHPTPSDEVDRIATNPIWQWSHHGDSPGVFTDITAKVRLDADAFHRMTVCDAIVFRPPRVTLSPGQKPITLPVTSRFALRRYFLREGEIAAADHGLFQLPALVDSSLLVVLGYEVRGGEVQPLGNDALETLGERLFPWPRPPKGWEMIAGNMPVEMQIAPPRFVVALTLTCCKERNDFEPGGVLGAARIYPHTFVVANRRVHTIETSIEIQRPKRSKCAGPEADQMQDDLGAVFFTDTNARRGLPGPLPPFPLWDNIFDYFETDPFVTFGSEELCFVDRDRGERTVHGAVRLESAAAAWNPLPNPAPDDYYADPIDFVKLERQGEFDSVHVAPRMKTSFASIMEDGGDPETLHLGDIVMAPFCIHDCLHMHVRWGKVTPSMPKWTRGFVGSSLAYHRDGAPMVPANQDVFVRLMAPHRVRYRAVAHGVDYSEVQCFMHHGLAYAIGVWPEESMTVTTARRLTLAKCNGKYEPFTSPQLGTMPDDWSSFYWRLRFGGFGRTNQVPPLPLPRIDILDLDACRR